MNRSRTGQMQLCIVRRTIGTTGGSGGRTGEEKNVQNNKIIIKNCLKKDLNINNVDGRFVYIRVVLSKSQVRPFDI